VISCHNQLEVTMPLLSQHGITNVMTVSVHM